MAIDFPSSPVNGDIIRIGQNSYIYDDSIPGWNLRTQETLLGFEHYEFYPTETTATFICNYETVKSEFVEVIHNGFILPTNDYDSTTGTSITLNVPAEAGDYVQIKAYNLFNIANTYSIDQLDNKLSTAIVFNEFTGDGIQTKFTVNTVATRARVSIGGLQISSTDYTVTPGVTSTDIDLISPAPADQLVIIETYNILGVADTYTIAETDALIAASDQNASEVSYSNTTSGLTASNVQGAIDEVTTIYAPLESPTFTGVVSGVTASMVGLGNVQNIDTTVANNITTGILDDARLSSNVTVQGNIFNGINQLVQLDGSGKLPALDGSALLNVSTVASIDDLTDVDTTTVSPNTGEALVWDGANWVPNVVNVTQSIVVTEYTVGVNSGDYTTGSTTEFPVVYTPGLIEVYRNGWRLNSEDFVENTGTKIILNVAADNGDSVTFIASAAFDVANTYTRAEIDTALTTALTTEKYIGDGITTKFTINTVTSKVRVTVGGVQLVEGVSDDFTVTPSISSTDIDFTIAPPNGQIILIEAWKVLAVADVYTIAETDSLLSNKLDVATASLTYETITHASSTYATTSEVDTKLDLAQVQATALYF